MEYPHHMRSSCAWGFFFWFSVINFDLSQLEHKFWFIKFWDLSVCSMLDTSIILCIWRTTDTMECYEVRSKNEHIHTWIYNFKKKIVVLFLKLASWHFDVLVILKCTIWSNIYFNLKLWWIRNYDTKQKERERERESPMHV